MAKNKVHWTQAPHTFIHNSEVGPHGDWEYVCPAASSQTKSDNPGKVTGPRRWPSAPHSGRSVVNPTDE